MLLVARAEERVSREVDSGTSSGWHLSPESFAVGSASDQEPLEEVPGAGFLKGTVKLQDGEVSDIEPPSF